MQLVEQPHYMRFKSSSCCHCHYNLSAHFHIFIFSNVCPTFSWTICILAWASEPLINTYIYCLNYETVKDLGSFILVKPSASIMVLLIGSRLSVIRLFEPHKLRQLEPHLMRLVEQPHYMRFKFS